MTDSTLENPGSTPAANAPGHDTRSLGPSDSSDSGSDVQNATPHAADMTDELDQHALELGEAELDSDSDRHGTGERASADGDSVGAIGDSDRAIGDSVRVIGDSVHVIGDSVRADGDSVHVIGNYTAFHDLLAAGVPAP